MNFFDQALGPISLLLTWLFFIEAIDTSFPSRSISRHCNSASQGRTTQSIWMKLYLKHNYPWFHIYSCGNYTLWRSAKFPRTCAQHWLFKLARLCLNLPSLVGSFVSTAFKYKHLLMFITMFMLITAHLFYFCRTELVFQGNKEIQAQFI